MEYIYAALLMHAAGKKIEEEGIKKVLKAAGIGVDDARVKALVSALEGVDIDEAIKKAAIAMPAAPAAASATEAQVEAKPEEKKEEKKKEEEEEKSEEEALAGLGALFG